VLQQSFDKKSFIELKSMSLTEDKIEEFKNNNEEDEFLKSEATIMNFNINELIDKWKEIEKTPPEDEIKSVTNKSDFQKSSGNVFKFLQQKQKEAREEESFSRLRLEKPLPQGPPLPKEDPAEEAKKIKSIRTRKSKSILNNQNLLIMYDYMPTDDRMIALKKGGVCRVIRRDFSPDWCEVIFEEKRGFAPINYIKFPADQTKITSNPTSPVRGTKQDDKDEVKSRTGILHGPKGLFDLLEEDQETMKKPEFLPSATSSWASLQEGLIPLRKSSKEEDVEIEINDPRRFKFEEPDSPENIIFKDTQPQQIRGATIEKLIQRLTHESFPDLDHLLNFLLTYRQITTPEELLGLLHLRFYTPKPVDMDPDVFKKEKLTPIRLRVINFIKTWLRRAQSDLKEGNTLLLLKEFVKQTIEKKMPQTAKELGVLISKEETQLSKPPVLQFSTKPPKPFIPKNLKSSLTLHDLHPEEIARQITLLEHELYRSIQSTEVIKQRWNGKSKAELSPNIMKLITWFNQFSTWVAVEILSNVDLKMRAVTLNKFIFIALKCRELNNYNACMEIVSALRNSSIHRLRQTWGLLPPKTIELYEELVQIMDGEGNFASYREQLQISTPPILPYLGLFLTDLVFIYDGNPDYIPNTKLINVAKLDLLASTIKILQRYQDTPYCLEKLDFVHDFIRQKSAISLVCDEEEMYKLSLKREEKRGRKQRISSSNDNS